MSRSRIAPAAATLAALLLSWLLWFASGLLVEQLGLAPYGLLPRVAIVVLGLGLAGRLLDPFAARLGDDRHA